MRSQNENELIAERQHLKNMTFLWRYGMYGNESSWPPDIRAAINRIREIEEILSAAKCGIVVEQKNRVRRGEEGYFEMDFDNPFFRNK